MSSVSAIRSAIATRLDAVSGVENVNDYVIWTDEWETILQKFAIDGRINTWGVGLGAPSSSVFGRDMVTNTWQFNMFFLYSVKTDQKSSQQFEGIIDNVIREFAANKSIATGVTNAPARIAVVENGVFAEQPVHRAHLILPVTEVYQKTIECGP